MEILTDCFRPPIGQGYHPGLCSNGVKEDILFLLQKTGLEGLCGLDLDNVGGKRLD